MKHLLPFALLCGLCAPAVSGQTVTILDKEGIAHRFNADYVKEITFSRQTQVEVKTYTGLEVSPYGNGNVELEFSGEGCPQVKLDVYGTTDALYLQTGEYEVGDGSPMSVKADPEYSYVMVDGRKVAVTGGRMTVGESQDGKYDISFEFTLADGSSVAGCWNGIISNYGRMVAVTAGQAVQVELNDPADGQVRLRLSGANYFEATVDFWLEAGVLEIPAGEYAYASGTPVPGTIGGMCEINFSGPDFKSSVGKAKGGSATVRDGVMTLDLDLEDGRTVSITFRGDIIYLDQPEVPVAVKFTEMTPEVYGYGNVALNFSGADSGIDVKLDVYGPTNAVYLMPGTYEVNATGDPMTIGNDPRYSYVSEGGENKPLEAGSMTVSIDEAGAYAVSFALTLTDGTMLDGTWDGYLSKYGKVMSMTADSAFEVSMADPADDMIRLRLEDQDANFSATVDFFVEPGTTELPQGMYAFKTDGAPGTIGGDTQVEFYRPSSSSKAVDGTVNINRDGVAVTLGLEDGRTVNIAYTGDIKYAERPLELVFANAIPTVYSNGNVSLNFTDEAGTAEMELDIYGPTDAVYLMPGTYEVNATESPMTVSTGQYSYLAAGMDYLSLQSGTMTVSLDDDDNYLITFGFVLSNGRKFEGSWTGLLPKYGKKSVITADSANEVELANPVDGMMRLRFEDQDSNFSATIDFFVEANAVKLADGTYAFSASGIPGAGHIGGDTQVEFYRPSSSSKAVGGTVTVAGNDITAMLELADGRVVSLSYTGEVKYLDRPDQPEQPVEPEGPFYANLSAQSFGGGNMYITLTEGENLYDLYLDMYCSTTATYIEPGTYMVNASTSPMNVDTGYSYSSINGNMVRLASGTVKVDISDDNIYTICIDVVYENGTPLKGWYVGKIEGLGRQ